MSDTNRTGALVPGDTRILEMGTSLLRIAKANHPQDFRDALLGLIANTVGNMPKDYFDKMIQAPNCTVPGCDCGEKVGEISTQFLTMLRADWEENVDNNDPQSHHNQN